MTRPTTDEDVLALLRLDANDGPALPGSPADDRALLSAALDAAHGRVLPFRTRPRMLRFAWAAAALLALSGSASAAVWWYGAREQPVAPAPVMPVVTAPKHRAPEPAPAVDTPAPPLVPESIAPQRSRRARAVESAPEAERVARDLLAEANALRARKDYAGARKLYARTAEAAPRSLSAHAALVAEADLALDVFTGAREARTLYDAALRAQPRGPLALEARYGLARAARALGDTGAEQRALREVLALAPDSSVGRAAQRRLDELRHE